MATNGLHRARRILFLEAYDSFSNNITALLKDALGDDVAIHVVHMDLTTLPGDSEDKWTRDQFLERLGSFDAVVCGPGPGTPLNEKDVGAFNLLWSLSQEQMVPVLGICLGFQSLVAASGGKIRRLKRGMHGMVRDIAHRASNETSGNIFELVTDFKATLYHSLCADIGQDGIPESQWLHSKWEPSSTAPELLPLAWVTEPGEGGQEDERILMAVKHTTKPFWGLQYHPESVCTDQAAHAVIKNWFNQAVNWNSLAERGMGSWEPVRYTIPRHFSKQQFSERGLPTCHSNPMTAPAMYRGLEQEYYFRELELPAGINATHIVDSLYGSNSGEQEAIILDSSSTSTGDALAANSIVALDASTAFRFEYRAGDDFVARVTPGSTLPDGRIPIGEGSVWEVLSSFWRRFKVDLPTGHVPDSAFRGGFMGYVSYEGGLHGLSPSAVSDRQHRRPDVCMAWITQSVVLDHRAKKIYVQKLGTARESAFWLDKTVEKLSASDAWRNATTGCNGAKAVPSIRTNEQLLQEVEHAHGPLRVRVPNSATYEKDVRRCQESIKAGDSYELCLTAQTTMLRPRKDNPTTWDMYKTLRARQPAPFGSYIRLGGATLLSSSPERFLQHDEDGHCTMRPMKGTVRKSAAVSTLAEAEKILHCPKEEAENLMIVDLVRHDLHAVCGPGRVSVPELLKVEEYASVFQMVTVVEGDLATQAGVTGNVRGGASGLKALGSMLPPGSMTGAPKKRSCEILSGLENRERSLYSGVVGYFDVTGQADWSVTIRSMFRWDDKKPSAETAGSGEDDEVWHIGAGGAVTILSTPDGEREEMLTKLCGPLGVFMDAA